MRYDAESEVISSAYKSQRSAMRITPTSGMPWQNGYEI